MSRYIDTEYLTDTIGAIRKETEMGKTFVEDERPCDSCVNATRYGCVSWNCEYINRDEAIKAWREKHEMADRKTESNSGKPNNLERSSE